MDFKTEEIVSLLKKQLDTYGADIDVAEVGEIIYVGDGKRHKMQIDAHNIWWNEEEETFQPYDKFKIIQPYEYNMYADEHNMEEDDDFDF